MVARFVMTAARKRALKKAQQASRKNVTRTIGNKKETLSKSAYKAKKKNIFKNKMTRSQRNWNRLGKVAAGSMALNSAAGLGASAYSSRKNRKRR